MNDSIVQPRRFFISYRRRASDDARLAGLLTAGLREVGHEVFIDIDIPLGTDWSAEITRRIRWCDYLVVLLSEDSLNSEMVQGEVRLARHYRREDGSPKIFPVRLRYEGPLDYELNSYIGRIQHIVWKSNGDDSLVLGAILAAARTGLGPPETTPIPVTETQISASSEPRPRPSIDPSALLRPTGTLRLDDHFYIRRPADTTIERLAAGRGNTLVIKGPRQVGKSSLLIRYLAASKSQGKQTAFVDFQGLSDTQLTNYAEFLRYVVVVLLRRFDLATDNLPAIESGLDATDLIEKRLLDRIDAPVVLAFEEVDRLLGKPWQNDFFGMLRTWHNKRWEDAWSRLDLALVIATEPYLLVNSADQSPFNVGEIVQMGRLDQRGVDELNGRYGSPLSVEQCQALFELTDGQPYLSRVALYRLITETTTWPALQAEADTDAGPFADHLKAMLMQLHRAGLEEAMREVVKRSHIPGNDPIIYYRLRGAGLIKGETRQPVPANLLYARFFKRMLQ
jgi:hypothetical protein